VGSRERRPTARPSHRGLTRAAPATGSSISDCMAGRQRIVAAGGTLVMSTQCDGLPTAWAWLPRRTTSCRTTYFRDKRLDLVIMPLHNLRPDICNLMDADSMPVESTKFSLTGITAALHLNWRFVLRAYALHPYLLRENTATRTLAHRTPTHRCIQCIHIWAGRAWRRTRSATCVMRQHDVKYSLWDMFTFTFLGQWFDLTTYLPAQLPHPSLPTTYLQHPSTGSSCPTILLASGQPVTCLLAVHEHDLQHPTCNPSSGFMLLPNRSGILTPFSRNR